jgi:hypothetical protein
LFELRIGIFTARSLDRIEKSNPVLNKKEQNNQVPRQKIKKSIGSLVLLAGRPAGLRRRRWPRRAVRVGGRRGGPWGATGGARRWPVAARCELLSRLALARSRHELPSRALGWSFATRGGALVGSWRRGGGWLGARRAREGQRGGGGVRRAESWGKWERKRGGGGGLGGARGQLQYSAGMDSAWASCEARFELLNSAWLRGIICMRPAVLS